MRLPCMLLLPEAAIAQEYPGNFWVNPSTDKLERIEFYSSSVASNPYRVPSSRSADRWLEVARTLQGNDRYEVDTYSRKVTEFGRDQGVVRFNVRLTHARGFRSTLTSYRADCQNFDLKTRAGDRIDILPGSVAESIYGWACPD